MCLTGHGCCAPPSSNPMNRWYQKCVQTGFSSPFQPGAGVCGTQPAVGLRMWLLPPLAPLKAGNLSVVVRWGLCWARLLVCLGQLVTHQPGRRSGRLVSCPGRVLASNSGFPLVSCNLFYLAEDDVVWSPPPCSSYASHNHCLSLNSPIFPFACARKGFTARQTWTHFTQKKLLPLLHWYNMFTFPEHLQIGIGVKIDINKNSQCHLWGCFPGHNLDQACKAVYNGWNTYVISM